MITEDQLNEKISKLVTKEELDAKLEALSNGMNAKLEALQAKVSADILSLGVRMQGLEKQVELEARYNKMFQGAVLLFLVPGVIAALKTLFP